MLYFNDQFLSDLYSILTLWNIVRIHTRTYRAVTVRPGCYSALRSQCCGHGECVPATSTVTTEHAACVCDAGFSGLHCDYYQVRVAALVSVCCVLRCYILESVCVRSYFSVYNNFFKICLCIDWCVGISGRRGEVERLGRYTVDLFIVGYRCA